ncbi:adenylate/guanylate cyclase domain-containing protein [Rhodopseudomonas sp. BR0M22]|uniref:CHASE2 domain-containing protein n=1 Tax=Rhodopseudomonas sp. BR0M22 TaxID=2269369 RepID=UPI0013E02DF3|nr:adenylate/guanylate cyclase domain-containing protein [Rhodopseudomonas sp. BR0M22]NEW90778.1 adenylate/guanylate cyclase domain-containing protein [Rhodopseudomonas sp. BR0M22]
MRVLSGAAHPLLIRLARGFVRLRWLARGKYMRAASAALLMLLALTALRTYEPRIVTETKERVFDAYQRLKPRQPAEDLPVRIVDIDEASLATFGQWPWPRTRLAALTKRLAELGAGVIAYDIIFSEPDRTTPERLAADLAGSDLPDRDRALALLKSLPDHDTSFADAMRQTPAVLGFAATRRANDTRPAVKTGLAFVGITPTKVLPPFHGAVANLPLLEEAASGVGAINLSARDRGGVVRRLPMLMSDGDRVYPGLAVEALRVAQGQKGVIIRGTGASGDDDTGHAALVDMRVGQFKLPLTDDGEAWLYYTRDDPARYVSAKDVLDPAQTDRMRDRLEGTIVLVGATASGLVDARATAIGQVMPGVAIQAQMIEQVVSQEFLERPDWARGFEIVMTLLLGSLVAALVLLAGARFSLVACGLVFVGAIGGSWIAFSQFRLLIDPVYPSLATLLTYIAVERVLHTASDREKKFVRQAFGQYLAPDLLAQLERAPDGLRLGGEQRELSVMFMDVRGFTPISEALSATELVDFINTLLSPLSDAIQDELGTIDKYIGDSIMAFWNAPVDVPDHAARACRAALRMRSVVEQLNDADAFGFAARGLADPVVRIGIGLNTGIACVGNMGSARRFNYSAMGDVVNVAARIESASKEFGTDLLVSEEVARAAPRIALLEAGEIMLKGKSRPTRLYALAGDETYAATERFAELQRLHRGLLDALEAGDAMRAATMLSACRADAPPALAGLYDHFTAHVARLTGVPRPQLDRAGS